MWKRPQSYTYHSSSFIVRFIAVYRALLLLRGTQTHLLLLVLRMELLSWGVSVFIKEPAFKYLIIQGLFIVLLVLSVLFLKLSFFIILLRKLGVSPFHSWYLRVSKYQITVILWFFITFHKALPLLIIRSFFNLLIVVTLITINTIVLIRVVSLFGVILLSSSIHILWRLTLVYYSILIVILYWLLYTILRASIISITRMLYLLISTLLAFNLLVMCGIPPFSLFSFKLIRTIIIVQKRILSSWGFLRLAVIRIVAYFRIFISASKESLRFLVLAIGLLVIFLQV